jgi:hypothetical protein
MANSESTSWNKLQDIKEKNSKLWKVIVAGVAVLALVILLSITGMLFPSVGTKLCGLASAPMNMLKGLFGKKAPVVNPTTNTTA